MVSGTLDFPVRATGGGSSGTGTLPEHIKQRIRDRLREMLQSVWML